MTRRAHKPRVAWEDRFEMPTPDALVAGFPRHVVGLIQTTREGLLGFPGVREDVIWRGTWRWTLAYTLESDSERPWAYLVPKPGHPVLALPMSGELVGALPVKKISKAVRDGIVLAAQVGGVYWPQWELTTKGLVEELLILARRKHLSIHPAPVSAV
jgi:hypothetical protein